MRTEVICCRALHILLLTSVIAPAAALAQETQAPQMQTETAEKKAGEDTKPSDTPGASALGMSIVGNHEAPKALVLVPWKPSEPGKSPEISTKVDDSRNPIDKEAFLRLLRYYEIAKTAPRRK